jgi:hypothetical protein
VTRRADGLAVANVKVTAHWGHDELGQGQTGADGRYTVTVPRPLANYSLFVHADPDRQLAAVWYGDASCSYADTEFNVQGHVSGIDITMPKGYWVTMGARTAAGQPVELSPYLAAYLPQFGVWCQMDPADISFTEPPDQTRWTKFYPAGTYRIGTDPSQRQVDLQYPYTWYLSAATAEGGADVVLDRDLKGDLGKTVTLPARVYKISGRIAANLLGWSVQIVTMEGGRVGIAAEGYVRDFQTGDYAFVVPPGTYKVRVWQSNADGSNTYYYAPDGGGSYAGGRSVTITTADVAGVDLRR